MDNTAFGGKISDYAVCLRNAEISLLTKYVKQISRFLSLCDFVLDNAGS